jgi:hypothetical protein
VRENFDFTAIKRKINISAILIFKFKERLTRVDNSDCGGKLIKF